jgi:hypothetical protein
MKKTIFTTAAVLAALAFVGSANAATYYFYVDEDGTPGNWNVAANWFDDNCETHTSAGAVPTASDRAVICSGQVCNVDAVDNTTTVDTLDVQGTLNIAPNDTLTVQNNDDNGTGGAGDNHSVVDGTLNLEKEDAEPPTTFGKLSFTINDHQITGSGSIVGAHDSCQILLSSNNLDLTSSVTISGALAITSGASTTSFVNSSPGLVYANANGTLEISPDSIGDSSGSWQVGNDPGAMLWINASSAATHDGSVTVGAGELNIDYTFRTTGHYTQTGGELDVASGVTFEARAS